MRFAVDLRRSPSVLALPSARASLGARPVVPYPAGRAAARGSRASSGSTDAGRRRFRSVEDVLVRAATVGNIDVLTEIGIAAPLDQGRFPPDSDEFSLAVLRPAHAGWARKQPEGAEPTSSLSAVGIDGEWSGDCESSRPRAHRAGRAPPAGLQLLANVQGRGTALRQVRAVQSEAGERLARATLVVERDNPPARALYESLGFRSGWLLRAVRCSRACRRGLGCVGLLGGVTCCAF
jgi:GNAT superfamily N-acetyltransferase